MLNSTFSTTSARPWKLGNVQTVTPNNFTYVNKASPYNYFTDITFNGDAVFTGAPTSNVSSQNTVVLTNYFTTVTSANLGVDLRYQSINGSGNILVTRTGTNANPNVSIFTQTGYYTYANSATISIVGGNVNVAVQETDLDFSGNTFCISVGNGQANGNLAYTLVYDWDGVTANLVANINANSAANKTAAFILSYLNGPGNNIIITNREASNVQIHNKSGNTITLDANITESNINRGIINDYSNIVILLQRPNQLVLKDVVLVYKKISNVWTKIQTIDNTIGNSKPIIFDTGISMTGDANVLTIGTIYTTGSGGALVPRVYVYNYDSGNNNYALKQTIYNPNSNVTTSQFGISTNLSSNPGYLVIGDNVGNTLYLYSGF